MGPLARYVLDRRIHLEPAPPCNVQIDAVPSVAEHPIGPFLRAGFSVEAAFAPNEVRRRIVDDVVRPAYAALAAP